MKLTLLAMAIMLVVHQALALEKCSSIKFDGAKFANLDPQKDLIPPLALLMERKGVGGKKTPCMVLDRDGLASINLLYTLEVIARTDKATKTTNESKTPSTAKDANRVLQKSLNEPISAEEWPMFQKAILLSLSRAEDFEKAQQQKAAAQNKSADTENSETDLPPESEEFLEIKKLALFFKNQNTPMTVQDLATLAKSVVNFSYQHFYSITCKVRGDYTGWDNISLPTAWGISKFDIFQGQPHTTLYTSLDGLDDSCEGISGDPVTVEKAIIEAVEKK